MNRRKFLWKYGGGLGGIALASMLSETGALADSPAGLHFPARAKRVVQLFMSGAASQCDTFDYKPKLIERNGEKFDPGGKVELFQSSPGAVMKSPWEWKQRGKCGKWVSDLVPHLGSCVDDIAFVHNMVAKSNVHGPATFMQNTGFVLPGFPSMGSWISYGLGSMNDNLPTFVVLPDSRGFAPGGPGNWSAGFLPAGHQGTLIRASSANPIYDLFPPKSATFITPESERDGLALLKDLNREQRDQTFPAADVLRTTTGILRPLINYTGRLEAKPSITYIHQLNSPCQSLSFVIIPLESGTSPEMNYVYTPECVISFYLSCSCEWTALSP